MSEESRPPAVPSDAALIVALRQGDDAAYGELYRRHIDAARGLARQLVHGGSEVDDVVSETFARVLDLMRRGGGPESAFRPYLLTAVRRVAYDRFRTDKRSVLTDEIEGYDPGTPFVDPAVAGLERSLIARAFYSLPERWRAVLWHTEVEEARPADVAPLLGLSANGVAALAYRAREGLRQAYLQMHLSGVADETCRPALERLGAYVRGGLSKRETPMVERHLADCADCRGVYAELADVNVGLKGVIGPLIAGPALGGYLAAHAGGAGLGGVFGWWTRMPKRAQQGTAAGAAAAVAAAAVAFALVADHGQPPRHPQAAARPTPKPPPQSRPKPNRPQPKPPVPKPPVPKPRVPHPAAAKRKPPRAAPAPHHPSRPPATRAPRPIPTKSAPPRPRLTARVGSIGELVRGQYGIVGMWVTNAGRGASRDVTADITLPPGVAFTAPSGPGGAAPGAASTGGGWTCRPSDDATGAVRCAHGAVPSGGTSRAYLRVQVARDAPLGTPPRVAVHSDGVRLTARGRDGVRATGLAARYATAGNVRTVQAGNALLSCPATAPGCDRARHRLGDRRDDDLWDMSPYDADDDPGTSSSSAAKLALPGRVRWAGLYWSGVRTDGDAGTAKLRGPGQHGYTTVHTTDVRADRLPSFPAYQAFADVTAQVRRYGAGTWWGADVPTATGATHYAGWSLVVVTDDPSAPYAQAAVLDSTPDRVLSPANPRLDLALSGLLPAAVPARIGVLAWEGDAGLAGDRVKLGGRALRPAEGDRDAGNVMDGSAHGAAGPSLTFGVDVKTFTTRLPAHPALTFTTHQDAYLLGVITLTSPMRT